MNAAPPSEQVPLQQIVAILDANVFLDLCSIHDLARAEPSKIEKRLTRARDALLLGICLHEMAATTYGLREPVDVHRSIVPANSGGLEEQFIKLFFLFVHPETLAGWDVGCSADLNARGNAADRLLISEARRYERPLISLDSELAKRARSTGVVVCSPSEFYAGRLRNGAMRRFLSRFKARAPAFARTKRQAATWAKELDGLYSHYRWLLLGRG